MIYYRQCRLQKGDHTQTSFIPEAFARLNKVLRLKDDDGWKVVEVGSRINEELVKRLERDHLTQREGSDI